MTTTEVVVGRVGRAHGVKGEVSVEPRTDEPDRPGLLGPLPDAGQD
jgi:16S rRNA processing protein RimM